MCVAIQVGNVLANDTGFSLISPKPSGLEKATLFLTKVGVDQKAYESGRIDDVIQLKDSSINGTGRNLNGNDYISLSYEGSTGLLGFSSGYIYPADNKSDVISDLTTQEITGYLYADKTANVYMGLDIGHSIELTDDIVLGLQASVIYLGDIYSEENDSSLSLLFLMPLEINDNFKIIPRIHWSRSLKYYLDNSETTEMNKIVGKDDSDTFFGGVSISFAY